MRWVLLLLVLGEAACASPVAEGTVLVVPARDLAENHVEGAPFELRVPAEDLAAHPGPRPKARLVVPED
jgi:hypothetical protein